MAHQTRDDDSGGMAGPRRSCRAQLRQDVGRAGSSGPVHAGHGAGEQECAPDSFPPGAGPGAPEDEEERQGDGARGHSDDGGAGNIRGGILAVVIADGGVSEVVHTADRTARERPRGAQAPPVHLVVLIAGARDHEEGEEQHQDRNEERSDGDSDRVGDLKIRFAAQEDRCAVPNVMLRWSAGVSATRIRRAYGSNRLSAGRYVPCSRWQHLPSLPRPLAEGGYREC